MSVDMERKLFYIIVVKVGNVVHSQIELALTSITLISECFTRLKLRFYEKFSSALKLKSVLC